MALFNHPAYTEEQTKLKETRGVIHKEQIIAEDELYASERELKYARAYDPDKLPIREMLYTKAAENVKTLALADVRPYFTRIDFKEDSQDVRTYYIGKYGVTNSDSLAPVVIDWRAPLANLYYSGQLGRVNYTAPDGKVEGELTLKRQLDVQNGELISIFDTDIVSQDSYLQNALNAMSGDRLKEIVTTIQAEQNYVIRHPLRRSLIVQGAAGSGKTTIALHRIAYLLYAFQQQLKSENMLILAPNPLFLNYIAGVLPDLGVDRVMQTTFTGLISNWLPKSIGKIDTADRTERVLSAKPEERARITEIARTKGSIAFMRALNAFLNDYETNYAPDDGIAFGPIQLWSKEEMDRFLLEDEKPFPMARRVEEFKKQLTKRANNAAKRMNAYLMKECERRMEALYATEKDPALLRQRLKRLYETRDERLKQTLDHVKPFVKNAIDALPTLEPRALYTAFLKKAAENDPDGRIRNACSHTLMRMEEKKPLEMEDLAPIAYIAMRVLELKKFEIRHIVIDEAQDFSPFEFELLSKMMSAATFTIVGDLMQGIHAWRGTTDWNELKDCAFYESCERHMLVTSYRNTVEIMNAALLVAKRRPAGSQEVRPVERHGQPPTLIRFHTQTEQLSGIISELKKWQADGMRSICIIARTEKEAKRLAAKLPAETGARLMDVNSESYESGVYVAPASAVKGLEFDGVIIADASADEYPDDDLNARLLYVCLTRPLHRLTVFYTSALSKLLEGMK